MKDLRDLADFRDYNLSKSHFSGGVLTFIFHHNVSEYTILYHFFQSFPRGRPLPYHTLPASASLFLLINNLRIRDASFPTQILVSMDLGVHILWAWIWM